MKRMYEADTKRRETTTGHGEGKHFTSTSSHVRANSAHFPLPFQDRVLSLNSSATIHFRKQTPIIWTTWLKLRLLKRTSLAHIELQEKEKVKLSVCTPVRQEVRTMKVRLHAPLTSAEQECEYSASHSRRFIRSKEPPPPHPHPNWMGGRLGSRAGVIALRSENLLPVSGIKPWFLSFPVRRLVRGTT